MSVIQWQSASRLALTTGLGSALVLGVGLWLSSSNRDGQREAGTRTRVDRRTVDLSAYPDLVVIYLGMRVNALTGIKTVLGLGPQIANSAADHPDGLLLHENVFFSLRHVDMRQYWRDFDSLERWTRTLPHQQWWRDFLRDSRGTGFWHEAYLMRGGMEGVYADMEVPVGFMRFAPVQPARGALFSARERLRLRSDSPLASVVTEPDYYSTQESERQATTLERP